MLSRINLAHIDDFKIYPVNNNIKHSKEVPEFLAMLNS